MMRRLATRCLKVLLAIYVGVLVVLMLLETKLVYPAPGRSEGDWNAALWNAVDAEFESSDGTRLHGWYVEAAEPRGALLLCHGNGEHVAYLGEEAQSLSRRLQMNVLVFDYRGYGRSQGKPFEAGLLADGEAAIKWLQEQSGIPASRTLVIGRSLGGAVAVHLGSKQYAHALVLDRTFSSLVDVAAGHFPWLPVRYVMRNRYPSAQRIKDFRGPLLSIHGVPDEVVPYASGVELYEAATSERKEFCVSETLRHNSHWPTDIDQRFTQFVFEHFPQGVTE